MVYENKLKNIRTYIFFRNILRDSTESDDIFIIDICWHHVNFARCVDVAEKFLIDFIGSFQAKANQTQLKRNIYYSITLKVLIFISYDLSFV